MLAPDIAAYRLQTYGFGPWDAYNATVARLIMEQQLMLHGYASSIKVNELDDEDLLMRHMILQGILERQKIEQELITPLG